MRCTEVQEQLNRFHDAELPLDLRERIEDHLAGCAQCRVALENLKGLKELWVGLERPLVPDGFAERVMRVARDRRAHRPARLASWLVFRSWWWEQSLVMRAAAAAVVVGASVAGLHMSGNSAPRSGSAGAGGLESTTVAVGGAIGFLSGAAEGSLEHSYLMWTDPAGGTLP